MMHSLRPVFGLLALAVLAACSDDDPTTPGADDKGRLSVGFRMLSDTSTADVPGASQATTSVQRDGRGLVLARAQDTIIVTRAQLVVRDVQVARTGANCPDAAPSNGGDASCPTVHVGPYLIDIPTSGTATSRIEVDVPEGTYTRMRLRLHKVSSADNYDKTIRDGNPALANASVRLEGTYNGQAFTFISDVNSLMEVNFPQGVTVGDNTMPVTVAVDVGTWFDNPSGGLISPILAAVPGALRTMVDANIKTSIDVFRDTNNDGTPD